MYYSYDRLPELSGFTPEQRRVVWRQFSAARTPAQVRLSRLYGVAIVIGLLAGLAVGVAKQAHSLIFMAGGVLVAAALMRLFHVDLSRAALRAYLASDQYRDRL